MEGQGAANDQREALNVLLRLRLDGKNGNTIKEKKVCTLPDDYRLRVPERVYQSTKLSSAAAAVAAAAACKPSQLAALCLNSCLGGQTPEQQETIYHKQLKSEVSALREFGNQMKERFMAEGLAAKGLEKGLGFRQERNGEKKKKGDIPPNIIPPLFIDKKEEKIKEKNKKRSKKEEKNVIDSQTLNVLTKGIEGTKQERAIHSIIQFFEGNTEASRDVRRLEFENRQLCAAQRLHDSQCKSLYEKIEGLEKENNKLKKYNQEIHLVLQTQKEATQQELELKEEEINALKKQLKETKDALAAADKNIQEGEEKIRKMEAALETKTQQCLNLSHAYEEQKRIKQQTSTKVTRRQKSMEPEPADTALTEALIRLEKLAWTCEYLGNEKLVAIESYKRAKAKEALARSEVEVYKKYLEELTEERDHYYHTAIKTKEEGLEKESYYKSKEENLIKTFNTKIQEKEKQLFASNEKQIQMQTLIRQQKHNNAKYVTLIQQQRELLRKAAAEFKTLSAALQGNNKEAQQLKRLAQILNDRLKDHEHTIKTAPRVEEPQEEITEEQLQQAMARLPSEKTIKAEFEKAAGEKKTLDVAAAVALSRRLGFAPSYEDIEHLSAAVAAPAAGAAAPAAAAGGVVTLEKFVGFCVGIRHAEDTPETLAEGLGFWDKEGRGFININQLKYILSTYGETLTEEEINIFIQTLTQGETLINYKQLCDTLLQS